MIKVLFTREGSQRSCLINGSLPQMPAELAAAWSTWLGRHGISADDVLVGWPIVCDDETRTISWTAPVLREKRRVLNDDKTDFLREPHSVQLEAPALLMPDEPDLGR